MASTIKKPKLNSKGLDKIFGEGINDLISDIEKSDELKAGAIEIAISQIRPNPYQPRKIFSEVEIAELGQSIAKHGVIQPIIVKKSSIHGYDLIAGERRTRAAKFAGLEKIPAIIVDFDDNKMMEIALIENLQRVDLNGIEEALAYQNLMRVLKLEQGEVALRVGKSRSHITNVLRILTLPKDVQNLVLENKITMGHIRPLVVLNTKPKLVIELANKISDEKLSVRNVEDLVKYHLKKFEEKPSIKKSDNGDIHLTEIKNKIMHHLGTKVEIKNKKIVISYTNNNNLNKILEKLGIIE